MEHIGRGLDLVSWDLTVYVSNMNNITKEACESHMLQFGIRAQIHPEIEFATAFGFVPFKVEFPSVNFLCGQTFLSGFELSSDSFNYLDDLNETARLRDDKAKKCRMLGIFKKK